MIMSNEGPIDHGRSTIGSTIKVERARKKRCQMGWDALNYLTDPLLRTE